MIVHKEKPMAFFDVDSTLVIWNPVNGENVIKVELEEEGIIEYLQVYTPHIKMLRQHLKQGHIVTIWSQGGALWAKSVVNALIRENYLEKDLVDLVKDNLIISSKPTFVYDDLPYEAFMPKISYLEE